MLSEHEALKFLVLLSRFKGINCKTVQLSIQALYYFWVVSGSYNNRAKCEQ